MTKIPCRHLTPLQFLRWQRRMGWSVTETAAKLGVGERQIYMYRSGKAVVPGAVTLLCEALERERAQETEKPPPKRKTSNR